MTAYDIVEALLEDEPGRERQSHMLLIAPGAISDRSFASFSSDGKRSALVVMLNNVLHVDAEGDRARDLINYMLDHGYSIILRNKAGSFIVYGDRDKFVLPLSVTKMIARQLKIYKDSPVALAKRIVATDVKYRHKQADDVFPVDPEDLKDADRGDDELLGAADSPSSKRGPFDKLSKAEADSLGGVAGSADLAYTP